MALNEMKYRTLTYKLLPRFLALSIAIHVYLLEVYSDSLLNVPELQLGNSVLEIHMHEDAHAPIQILSPKIARTFAVSENISAHAIIPVERIASTDPAVSAADIDRPRASITTSDTREDLRNQLLGVLKSRLSQYLSYPTLARSRGWEGTVLLGMRVQSDGQLNQLRIDRSSGYSVLDHSALNSLNRVGQLAEATAWLKGREMDMQLPVIYRLIEN